MSARKIIILFIGLEFAIIVIFILSEGLSVTTLQTITRYSGRLSLLVFSVIFLGYHKPEKITAWLSNEFYLLFAIVHGIHLAELLLYIYLSHTNLVAIRIAGGFFAYAYIFSMPVLQRYKNKKRLSPITFFIVETVFVYYVWLIFFLTYLPRVQGKLPQAGGTFAEHVALLGWVSTLLGMKLASLVQFPKRN